MVKSRQLPLHFHQCVSVCRYLLPVCLQNNSKVFINICLLIEVFANFVVEHCLKKSKNYLAVVSI